MVMLYPYMPVLDIMDMKYIQKRYYPEYDISKKMYLSDPAKFVENWNKMTPIYMKLKEAVMA